QVLVTDEGSVRFHAPDALGVVVLLIGTLSLTWRRRAPLLVLAASAAAFFVYHTLGYAPPPLPFAPLIALYTAAALRSPRISATAAAAIVVGLVAAGVTEEGPLTDDQFLAYLTSAGAAWMLGYGVQLGRARASLWEGQAVQLAREQAERTKAAIRQEQARIARELHDIVAHNVSVIVAQAGAAQKVFDTDAEQSRQALHSIEMTGREALTEMRRLLNVLHTDAGQDDRAPQPGLDQLPSLVAHMRRAGLPVELTVRGRARPLAPGVELSAYRIIQEALTNVLKHAGPTRAWVELVYHPASLELTVRDEGRGSAQALVAGHGLVGMRQRVALVGGELTVGPARRGGFEVTAKLPVGGG
ncbi:MAG: sensor histidine kinase, partial [Mycobacterium leprae]